MENRRNVIYTYMPPKVHAFLVQLQAEYGLSIQEVMTTILRKGLQEFMNFRCPHERIRMAKKTGLPYCFDCWTRMQQVTAPTINYKGKTIKEGTYQPIQNFLEVVNEDLVPPFPVQSTGTKIERGQKQDII